MRAPRSYRENAACFTPISSPASACVNPSAILHRRSGVSMSTPFPKVPPRYGVSVSLFRDRIYTILPTFANLYAHDRRAEFLQMENFLLDILSKKEHIRFHQASSTREPHNNNDN